MEQDSFIRRENKYIMEVGRAGVLRKTIGTILLPDPYSGSTGYQVRSLYFDTPDNDAFELKLSGVMNRKKVRLRTYSPDSEWCFLEEKSKSGELSRKSSVRISRTDARLLIRGEYHVLLTYVDENREAARLYSVMQLGLLQPVAMIEYHRFAYMHPEFRTRVTFDSSLMSSEYDYDLFARQPAYTPLLQGRTVLEVKYDGTLLKFISDTLKPYKLTRSAVSKYCIGRPLYYL